MENVEIKEEIKAVVKKKVVKKAKKSDANKVKFMEHMNERRLAAGHKDLAYSVEEIAAFK